MWPFKNSRWLERLEEFERVMADYFRRDLLEELPALLKQEFSLAEEWFRETGERSNQSRDEYNAEVNRLNALKQEIDALQAALKRKPALDDSDAVDDYNRRVRECNAKAQQHGKLVAAFKEKFRDYDRTAKDVEQQAAARRKELTQHQSALAKRLDDYQRWLQNKGPERFCSELNGMFAELHAHRRKEKGKDSQECDEALRRLRTMRLDLAGLAKQRAEKSENGMLLVDAQIGGETCSMIVDTGSSITTLTRELVQALDLEGEVGREVELSLPAGITIKAPQLLIPDMQVAGQKAQYIKGVVLPEATWGVDGSIGQSFLARFNYAIEGQFPRSLTLRPRRSGAAPTKTARSAAAAARPGSGQYHVFISHSSEDRLAAHEVYELLNNAGYEVFFSPVSIGKVGVSLFQEVIDNALEASRHLVVVGSKRSYLDGPWVKAEWSLFEMMSRDGRKSKGVNNIVNVLAGNGTVKELPVTLSRYQAIFMRDANWKTELVHMLPK